METVLDLPKIDFGILLRVKNMGSWLTSCGTTVTGTVLSGMEFCDFICGRYNPTPPPPNLQGNVTIVVNPSTYVMDLIANTEDS